MAEREVRRGRKRYDVKKRRHRRQEKTFGRRMVRLDLTAFLSK